MMLKKSLDTPANEAEFLRRALRKDIRLDGRRLLDWREVRISLSRDECRSEADVSVGETRVVVIVTGEIIKPFADRPTEGVLQFSADLCLAAEAAGYNQSHVCRLIERSLKDSDCIDLESLTLIAGEQVWAICCDIRVLSFHGNMNDVTSLAIMCALRAFRKPEASIILEEKESSVLPEEQVFTTRSVKLYTEDEREPLPLALHHTPLTVSIGLFQARDNNGSSSTGNDNEGSILVSDLSRQEELAVDGLVSFSINSHNEICSIVKPGGTGISLALLMTATGVAIKIALKLHEKVVNALKILELEHSKKKESRLSQLRKLREAQASYNANYGQVKNSVTLYGDPPNDGGLSIDDPLLRYDFTHVTTGCTSPKKV